jgi:phage gp36-like protein
LGSQYCTPTDVGNFATNSIALSSIPPTQQNACCIAASELLDSHFRGRYPLPLLTWGTDVTMNAAYIAAYLMYSGSRGAVPMKGSDLMVKANYDAAIKWAEGVQRQTIHPDVTTTPFQGSDYQFPQVQSPNRPRGWTR